MTSQHPDDLGESGNSLRERSLPELLQRLSAETSQLVHEELELAKAELSQKGELAAAGAGLFGGAAAIGLLALAALTTCIILALANAIPAWLAALIVAVVYAGIAAVLAIQGRAKVKEAIPPVPEQTMQSVKEDAQWARTQTRSARR
jgi:uncharacterized membrane protein YqjE